MGLKNAIWQCGQNGVEYLGIGILTDHIGISTLSLSASQGEDLSGASSANLVISSGEGEL